MRDFLKRSRRWLTVGWFWPLVLLALPTCALDSSGIGGGDQPPGGGNDVIAFEPGDEPLTSAVMCDLPQLPADSLEFLCADPVNDIPIGMPDSQAAVALNLGDGNSVVLDYSAAAFNQCGIGNPRRIDFVDNFPTGTAVCLNCLQQIPSKYADPNAVCVAKCKEIISSTSGLSTSQIDDFCAKAHVSTNFDQSMCSDDFCTTGGMPLSPLPDLRINPEPVTWVDVSPNSTATGNTLTFPGPGDGVTFDGGAVPDEIILRGDAWVEFAAGELLKTHVIGVRTSCDKAANCPDADDTLADIPLVISLNVDNTVNIVQNGVTILATAPDPYQLTDRFRIHIVDRHDGSGTADISFTRLPSPCTPGGPCTTEDPIYSLPLGTGPSYPLQIDATFREGPASLVNVMIMRIKP